MPFKIYLYDKDGTLIGIYIAPSKEEFEADKSRYCSEYIKGENYISYDEVKNPIVENGNIREMKISELISTGKITLSDGQYLDNEEIKTIPKPNEYSKWDKDTRTWIEDKVEKLQYFKDTRYSKQQDFIKFKKELEEKEDEKAGFESLGFDTTETEERITEIKSEMELLKTEITKLSKEITTLSKK